MEFNILLLIVIAAIMTLIYGGFFDALRKAVTTGVWDYGYMIAIFIYSVVVGVVASFTGAINLDLPIDQMWPALSTVFAMYFTYLGLTHAVLDYVISKIWPTQIAGLATKFLQPATKQYLTTFRR